MTENLKKFLEEASKNEELKEKLAAQTDKETMVDKAVEIAKEYGFALTAADFQPAEGEAVSEDELKQVTGGDFAELCDCVLQGNTSRRCICLTVGISCDDFSGGQV